ncbi:Peroxidase 31 [Raphanus sativus]|uniref:Peroxidase n=1 Tax=Raphanus sativus TaxID=3726 RepID=A0A6J0JEN3_RAPSA|nr:peroxidase 31-like [Raphanus sativus]XP_056843513.1 peroxidase 31-like [Raphanus sativus]KAJ4867308.1 Peroxidase 31 [Raphanus sativus]KAJ4888218.1 Peroxidase 31 [Raphanus sativus]
MAELKSLSLFFFFFLFTLLASTAEPRLTTDFYSKSCPRFHDIVRDTISTKQITNPTTAAAVLRLFFHDCFPNGCDASILISSTAFNSAERDSPINLSLPGDGFDAVVRAKTALELACPNTVSCSDIISAATRDLLVTVGGPHYPVFLGRRDSRISKASLLADLLPLPSSPISKTIRQFESRGFSVQEMVALSGAHSIGFSHCKEFVGLVGRNSTGYNPRFAVALTKACSNYPKDPTLSVFNDINTPNKFDNMYYQNIPKGLGLLESDHGLYSDPRTRPFVDLYARDQDRFFKDFANAMQKLSLYGVQTGRRGEIRRRCDEVN